MNIADIPAGEGRTMAVGGEQVAVFRLRDGTLRALNAVCPHRGGPLADGLLDNRVVVCPLHGFTYDLVSGIETTSDGVPVGTFPVAVSSDGTITVGTH